MSKREPAALTVCLTVALLAAAWLRFSNLGVQTPFHDEWHSLLAASSEGAGSILSTFGANDRSIPITLYLHGLVESNQLNELRLWLPSAAGGTLAVVALPLLLSGSCGWTAAATYSLLLAFSPLLVYFSRSARPYSLAAPLAVVALSALARWAERGGRRWLALWGLAATLTSWMLPVYLPFCFFPLLPLLWRTPEARRARRERFELAGTTVLAIGLTGALLLPPVLSDLRSLDQKIGRDSLSFGPLARAVELLAGGGPPWLTAIYLIAAGLALAQLATARSSRIRLAAWSTLGLLGSLALIRPYGIERPFVLARYLLPIGLLVLLLTALGTTKLPGLARRGPWGRTLPAISLLAATIATVPLAWPRDIDNFASMRQFHRLLDVGSIPPPEADFGGFYETLAERPSGSLRIIEAPFHPLRSHRFEDYQAIHRQWVAVGFSSGPCGLEPGLAEPLPANLGRGLSNLVSLDDGAAVLASGADYVVLHSAMGEEITHVQDSIWQRFDAERCSRDLTQRLGVQPSRFGSLIVFDLARASDAPGPGS